MKDNNKKLLVIGIIFAAISMRSPMSAVGPLVGFIQTDLGMSSSAAGLITTIPLLLFAFVSPLAGLIAPRFRTPSVVLASLILIVMGGLLRSYSGISGLYFGTTLLGLGIGTLNVMQLAIIREQFPEQIGLMTGLYTTSMNLFSAMGSGLSISAFHIVNNWRNALSMWSTIAFIAIIIWLKISQTGIFRKINTSALPVRLIRENLKTRKLWLISGFTGLQAMIYFCVMAWLPSILSSKTGNIQTPGMLMLLLQIVSLMSGFIASILTQKLRSRLPIVIAASSLYLSGLLLVLIYSSLPGLIIGCTLIGLASGTSFSYALVLIGLNGSTLQETAWLSGFSQMIGLHHRISGDRSCWELFFD